MSEIGSGSGSSFPSAIDTDSTKEVNSPNASKTKARAEVPNDLAACVVAIESELGTDPAGSLADVKTFLQTEHSTDGTHSDVTADSITMQSGKVQWSKGNDVASATALPLLSDGNIFDVTGTTTITSFVTLGIGTVIKLHFDGALTLTHSASDLVLPDGLDIVTVAGDEFEFYEYATGDWRMTGSSRQQANLSGNMIQMVNVQDGVYVNTATSIAIPYDDTTPQITEGDEYMTLAITPTSATNKLKIDVVFHGVSASDAEAIVALFQDTTANSLAVGYLVKSPANHTANIMFTHYMTTGTTSATTFRVRAGGSTTAAFYFNGASGGGKFNGLIASSITITEIKV